MSRHDLVWMFFGLYILGGLAYFGVAEGIALANRTPGDTLTEVIRSLGIPDVVWFVLAGIILGVTAWVVPHFIGKLGL